MKFTKPNPKQSFPELEKEIIAYWKENNTFQKSIDTRSESEEFNFYDGPPFATGTPHYGHILAGTIKDVIPRYQTMLGKKVERKFGWDCHGLPIEGIVEKKMNIKSKKQIDEEIGVHTFNEECRANVMIYTEEWRKSVERMGRWVDMDDDYKTMDKEFMESIWWVFKELYKKGYIYEDYRVVPYSVGMATPLSNFEVNQGYQDKQDKTITVKLKVKTDTAVVNYKESTGIVIKNSKGQILLGKKKKNGLLTFPGGKTEKGESPLDCIKRELFEETGLELRNEKLFSCNTSYSNGENWKEYVYEMFLEDETLVKNPEVDKFEHWKFYDVNDKNLSENNFETHSLNVLKQLKGEKEIFKYHTNGGKYFLAWTTTPWTLVANLGLAVGKDVEYVELLDKKTGETYILAKSRIGDYYKVNSKETGLSERPVSETDDFKIIREYKGSCLVGLKYEPLFPDFVTASEIGELPLGQKLGKNAFSVVEGHHVTDESGTGIVHIAPAYGEDDMLIGKEHDLGFVSHIDDNGYTSNLLEHNGEFVFDYNEIAINECKKMGVSIKIDTIMHSYPHCWRTDVPLIYRAISAWYVSVEKIKDKMLAANENINWVPDNLKHGRFGKWLEGARDWNISRNRYWGSAMPVWQSEDKKHEWCVGSIEELYELNKDFGQIDKKNGNYFYTNTGKEIDLHKHFVDDIKIKHPESGVELKRIPEVLDCWFESGSMPYASKHYPFENKENFKFPADFIAEGIDQTRGWFYTLVVLSAALFDKNPFNNVIVNGIVLAEDGKKMSKRLQNYPDPTYLMDKYGADAMRFYLMNSPVVEGQDLRFSEAGVEEVVKKVILPLWNTYSFFTTYANIDNFEVEKGNFFYIRHGQTDNNAKGIVNGGDDDIDLNQKGIEDIHYLGKKLKSSGMKFDVIITSPMTRTKHTTDILNKYLGKVEVLVDESFREQSYGEFRGMTHDEIRQKYSCKTDRDLTKVYRNNKEEPLKDFEKRVINGYKKLEEKYKGKNILIVSHGGVFRPLNKYLNNLEDEVAYYGVPGVKNSILYKLPNYKKSNPLDKWIISELNKLIEEVGNSLDNYKLNEATKPIVKFMDNLTNWYIRRSRKRFWKSESDNDKIEAYNTLYDVIIDLCKIIAPFMPFVSESIYKNLTKKESVHLDLFPNTIKAFVIDSLNEDMRETQNIVTLGLSARANAKIRVRQPLSYIKITRELNNYYKEIIKEELNIKEVKVFNTDEIPTKICKPNARLIGPKFGKDVKFIISEAKAGIFEELNSGQIKVGDFILENGEFELEFLANDDNLNKNEIIESGLGIVLSLNTQITDELLLEGYARDIVRQIQESRKQANFEVDDRIKIELIMDNEKTKIIKQFGEYIQTETLSTITQNISSPDIEKEIEIEDFKIILKLKK